jgi:tetratricopeptide (TPR) repeat protein
MPPVVFSPDWLQHLSDPYAVLGISVVANEKQILKRYRQVAKMLHPDRYILSTHRTQEVAEQLIARLVNPAYEKLKQEASRRDTLALLRLQASRSSRTGTFVPKSDVARALMRQPLQMADEFYEHALLSLAEQQFQPIEQFSAVTQQLSELNLIYFQLQLGDLLRQEKRTGLITATEVAPMSPTVPQASAQAGSTPPQTLQISYAYRHYERAKQYVQHGFLRQATQELKDAIRMEARTSEYHALLSYVYWRQHLPGAAKAYCRQALKLNPDNRLAQLLAAKLNLRLHPPSGPLLMPAKRGLLSLFRR